MNDADRRRSLALEARHRGERAAHANYGLIVVLAVIVAASDASLEARTVIASVVSAAIVTALAELYGDYIGGTIAASRHPTPDERLVALRNVAAGFVAALVPVVPFVLAGRDVISLDTAFDIAIWTGVGLLGAYAVVANRLAGMPLARSLLLGFGFTLLGALLVGLKSIL